MPVFFDVGENWVVGQVPRNEPTFGFYSSHILKRDYFIRSFAMSGRYMKGRMKPPTGHTNEGGPYFPPNNLYDFLKAED